MISSSSSSSSSSCSSSSSSSSSTSSSSSSPLFRFPFNVTFKRCFPWIDAEVSVSSCLVYQAITFKDNSESLFEKSV